MAAFDAAWFQPPAAETALPVRSGAANLLVRTPATALPVRRGAAVHSLPGAGTSTFMNYARKTADNSRVSWRSIGSPDPTFAYAPVAAALLNDHSFVPER